MQTGIEKKVYYILRIACAMCFIGHGAFGIITKAAWCNYFGVFGFDKTAAYTLMPYVGVMDILMGLLILFYPLRFVFGWLMVWGALTASLRPLSGEPFAEVMERAGNYGAPLALLLLTYTGEKSFKDLFKPATIENIQLNTQAITRLTVCLRIVVFLLFAGHGWLNMIEKKSLLDQYRSLGFTNAANIAHIVGSFEMLTAFSVLIRPVAAMLIILFVWKMASELFYPQWEIFEWVERGGSYGAILALWFLTKPSLVMLQFQKAKIKPPRSLKHVIREF